MQKYKVMVGSAFYTKAAISLRRTVGVENMGHISWPSNRLCRDAIIAIEYGVEHAIHHKG